MKSSKGYIYFIVDYQQKKLKIGHSTRPEIRLKEIQAVNPNKLVIAKLIPGTIKEEKKYHKLFCWDRIRRSEWFYLSPQIKEFLNRTN